jgi:hypothetical protein
MKTSIRPPPPDQSVGAIEPALYTTLFAAKAFLQPPELKESAGCGIRMLTRRRLRKRIQRLRRIRVVR